MTPTHFPVANKVAPIYATVPRWPFPITSTTEPSWKTIRKQWVNMYFFFNPLAHFVQRHHWKRISPLEACYSPLFLNCSFCWSGGWSAEGFGKYGCRKSRQRWGGIMERKKKEILFLLIIFIRKQSVWLQFKELLNATGEGCRFFTPVHKWNKWHVMCPIMLWIVFQVVLQW